MHVSPVYNYHRFFHHRLLADPPPAHAPAKTHQHDQHRSIARSCHTHLRRPSSYVTVLLPPLFTRRVRLYSLPLAQYPSFFSLSLFLLNPYILHDSSSRASHMVFLSSSHILILSLSLKSHTAHIHMSTQASLLPITHPHALLT